MIFFISANVCDACDIPMTGQQRCMIAAPSKEDESVEQCFNTG